MNQQILTQLLRHLLLGDSGRSDGFRTGRLVGGSRLGGAQDFVVFWKGQVGAARGN